MKTQKSPLPLNEVQPALQAADLFAMSRILARFSPISLEALDAEKLQDRVDTKFLFDAESLPGILAEVQQEYAILEIGDSPLQPYLTLYFDTLKFDNYFDHHNGKRPRYKVRMRKYLNSGSTFLEVKEKDNKNRTIKTRMAIRAIDRRLTSGQYQFVSQHYGPGLVPLKAVIWNRYNRMTLVNKHSLERVTIDLNFSAYNQNGFVSWNPFAIAEIKQGNRSLSTAFYRALKGRAIQPVNFSKYCISMALLTPQLKANKFKPNIQTIQTSLQRRLNHAF
ncbi:MAG: hypothetical protein PWQ55_2560 [Chloroflexota bacterium]|nr:hypothetical protein [Chloroflexota bacterium]